MQPALCFIGIVAHFILIGNLGDVDDFDANVPVVLVPDRNHLPLVAHERQSFKRPICEEAHHITCLSGTPILPRLVGNQIADASNAWSFVEHD